MRALRSLSKLTRPFLPSATALRAPSPPFVLLRHLHAQPPPPSPSQPPSSRILQSDSLPDPNPNPDPNTPGRLDQATEEFLARFAAAFRPHLAAAFPAHDRHLLDGMLLLVCQAVASRLTGAELSDAPVELSDDLWATVWEVSSSVRDAMHRDKVRAELRNYLHCDEVKYMCHFAAEVGIHGAMLRELRFKWARDKMDEVEFYRGLDAMRAQAEAEDAADAAAPQAPLRLTALPQRKGDIKFKIYGLDLSDAKWADAAERAAESERHFVPEEAQPVEGKAKMAEQRLLAMDPREGDPSPLIAEWKEELRPKRVDWLALLERIKVRSVELYLKVAEDLLAEESFEAGIRDYSKLVILHSKANRVEDVERILSKMKEQDIAPDILTSITLVHMYSKAGNLEKTKEAFESLRKEGNQPDLKVFSSMLSAYVTAGDPKEGENLTRQMDNLGIKPTKEIYMELMRAFAGRGMVDGAQRVMTTMQFAGIEPNMESFTLLVEAYGRAGDPDQARRHFDQMIRSGHNPDDRCTASMVAAYMKKNLLDKALDLLLTLEKDGFQPGIKTNVAIVDWLAALQLVQEAEHFVGSITKAGEAPLEIHVYLADMYAKAGEEKKAREALKVLEDKKQLLRADQFERVISGLLEGGFSEDAKRIYSIMQAQGFAPSETIRIALMAKKAMPRQEEPKPRGFRRLR